MGGWRLPNIPREFSETGSICVFDDPGVKLGKVRMVLWREKITTKNKVQDVFECAALNEKS